MTTQTSFRHYGKWQREEVLVLGYNSRMNDVIIARVTGLPVDDQVHLRQIASSQNAQEQNYLFPVLLSERHASGKDWCTYLLSRMATNDKSVMRVPFKDISDMNPQQKAFFGGWGAPVKKEVEAPVLGSPEANDAAVQAAQEALVDLPEGMTPAPAAPQPAPDAMATMAEALASLANSQAVMAASLEKLTTKVKAPRKTTARKKAVRRKPAPKAPVSEAIAEAVAPESASAE